MKYIHFIRSMVPRRWPSAVLQNPSIRSMPSHLRQGPSFYATATSTMTLSIEPLEECHFSSLREALDSVAREQRFLAFTEAPPPEQAMVFYASVLSNQWCLWVATLDGVVVGWCDVLPTHGQARAHVGSLGMGVVSAARGRGIGSALLRTAVDAAWTSGLTRIELSVRCDNAKAKALYERQGFVTEGLLRHAHKLEGRYFDAFAMALLRE